MRVDKELEEKAQLDNAITFQKAVGTEAKGSVERGERMYGGIRQRDIQRSVDVGKRGPGM